MKLPFDEPQGVLGWTIQAAMGALMLTLPGCELHSGDLDKPEYQKASALLQNADRAARFCLDDALHVLPEHSGNCVETARYLKNRPSYPKCNAAPNSPPRCSTIMNGWHQVLDMHWRAVAIGLARNHVSSGYDFYRDPNALLAELERCENASANGGANCVPTGDNGWPKLQ